MDMHVKIIAIPALSDKVGYSPKKGNTNNCNNVANKNPDPTSIRLSVRLRTCPHKHCQTSLVLFYLL